MLASQHRRTGQHPLGGGADRVLPEWIQWGGGGSSRNFAGSIFSGGGGGSRRNFPGSILCGVAEFVPLTAVTDPQFVLFKHVLGFARIMSTLCPNSCRQTARIGGAAAPPCPPPRPVRLCFSGEGASQVGERVGSFQWIVNHRDVWLVIHRSRCRLVHDFCLLGADGKTKVVANSRKEIHALLHFRFSAAVKSAVIRRGVLALQ